MLPSIPLTGPVANAQEGQEMGKPHPLGIRAGRRYTLCLAITPVLGILVNSPSERIDFPQRCETERSHNDLWAKNHLAYFVSDVIDNFDLSAMDASYSDERGQLPYDPPRG